MWGIFNYKLLFVKKVYGVSYELLLIVTMWIIKMSDILLIMIIYGTYYGFLWLATIRMHKSCMVFN